jgi:hypothetical protein
VLGVSVVGQSPSAGVLSDVTGGQFLLPEGFSLQIPMGRFVQPDGGILIEGQGVPLTVRVPVDETTVLSAEDVVLNAAEAVVSNRFSVSSLVDRGFGRPWRDSFFV